MADPAVLTLTLTPDNPSNTKITDPSGAVVYVAHTEHGKRASNTRIFDAAERVVASEVWSDTGLSGDKITIGDRAEVSASAWLHKSKIPFVE